MKTIFRIAKIELKSLFYSPIAWFLIVVFMIQVGLAYMSNLDSIARMQDSGIKLSFSLVGSVMYGARGVFGVVLQNLYLYLPLLTMGLISRETSSGTIRLLYSSPIHVRNIVLGKFFAMMIISAILTFIVSIYVCTTYFTIDSPDTGKLLSSLLGLYLLICAYASVGLFMSCLTSYQIVAALCTFVTIGILYFVGTLWQDVAFMRNLTYFLSMSGRTGKMLNGLITSKDLIYFAVIIYLFLGLTVYKLSADMESLSRSLKWRRYLLIIVSTFVIGYFSSIPQAVVYLDVTDTKANTITPISQKIIKEFGDEPLEITSYTNLLGGYWYYGSPDSYNGNLAKWEPYMRFKHNIILKNVYYYDTINSSGGFLKLYPGKTLSQVVKQTAESRDMTVDQFKTPEQIRKIIDLSKEPDWYTMQLKYKDRTTFLRVFQDNDQWPSETETSAAFKRLLKAKMPKILFVTGNLERNISKSGDRDYRALTTLKSFRYALLNQGFDVDTVSLDTQPVPADISALVLADPKMSLTATALERLQQYIDKGGNLLISGEPGKEDIINPFLKQFGVQLSGGTIVQQTKDLQQDLALPILTEAAAELHPMLMHGHHSSARVSMPIATAILYSDSAGYTIMPLLMTDSSKSWLRKGKLISDSATVVFEPQNGDLRQSFPLAVTVTRQLNGKEQRIVVAGDADFMGNAELQRRNPETVNFAFNTGLFSWLSYGEYPIDTSRPPVKDTQALVTKEQMKILKIVFIWLFPAVVLIFGMILLLKRKRK